MKMKNKNFVFALLVALCGFVFVPLSVAKAQAEVEAEVVHVEALGLVCDFCAQALEKVFRKQEHVTDIKVDLADKLITITFDNKGAMDDQAITDLITDSGYNVKAIHRDEVLRDAEDAHGGSE